MSPLLASLALLAVCWQPSAGLSWKMDTQNLVSLSKEQQSQVGQSISAQASFGSNAQSTAKGQLALFNLMPNTMIVTSLATVGAMDKLDFMGPSFLNGALCELGEPSLPGKLRQLHLDAGRSTEDVDGKVAGMLKQAFNIDCAAQPPTVAVKTEDGSVLSAGALQKTHKCFCTERKGAYCFFAMIKYAIDTAIEEKSDPKAKIYPCRSETVPALLKAGSGVLGSHYDLENFGQNAINDAFSGNVDAFSNDQMKNLLCDSIDPEVEAAVKAVYASDGLYWFTESLVYAMIFGKDLQSEKTVEMKLAQFCDLEEIKSNAYGKCFCRATEEGQGTGFTFCIYKVIAEYFVNEGYLTCDKADKTKQKFIPERKPRAIPNMVNATTVPANSTVGPSPIGAPTGGAATSSLTIASLAAAALLLLRQ